MKPYKNIQFIVNTYARHGKEAIKIIKKEMSETAIPYRIVLTEGVTTLEGIQKLFERTPTVTEDTLFVVVGGDGTLSDVVTLLEKTNYSFPIGYLPAGSGNDFARSVGIPMDVREALNRLLQLEEPRALDIIEAKSDDEIYYAVNSLGFGIDGTVIHSLEKDSHTLKKHLGSFAYLPAALTALSNRSYVPVRVEVEDQAYFYPASLLTIVANQPYFGGGIKIHPEADGEDGLLNLLVGNNLKLYELPKIIYQILSDQSHLNHPKVHNIQVPELTITLFEHEYGQKDGESIGKAKHHVHIKTKKRLFWV